MPNLNITYDEASSNIKYTNAAGETFTYQPGDIAWILASTALVWIMIPGLGFFYSGLLRRKNALSMMWMSVCILAVVSFQWFFWGYSLAFGPGSSFIGNLEFFGMMKTYADPSAGSNRIPAIVFCVYQLMFAAITPMIALGAVSERGRLGPVLVFAFVWATLVYDPIACWTWNPDGWSFTLGGLDFAGGSPVHISSGTAALAISIYLGKRRGYGTDRLAYKPNNTSYVILGTVFLWFGWFGFNGGSALSANLRAAMACFVTNLAAAVGGLTWMLWDYRIERKWSAVGFCSGAIAGLVAITPGSGFVGAPAAVLFGFMAGTVCNFATQLKFIFKYDDTLDIFASHGIGGIVGNVLTGLFAEKGIAALDGVTVIGGGWLDRNFIQLGYQLADSAAAFGYSFVMTTIILWLMHFIPFLRLRGSEDAEIVGLDEYDMGEFAYDYVGLEQEIGHEIETKSGEATTGGREPKHHSNSPSVEEK
ncbi:ammonium transporter [Moniliophthora roreri MCA 2997]|uniref:Ammonium transporter n=1 Tax=Moniliophthora roreri (strain MCA 2997) TaxID=1381753 RepID=V2X8Y3_MONRO|nr:ammonium transporter [Moniliophthora roreri MCA 2997]